MDVPKRYEAMYKRAMSGRSPKVAIKVFCLACTGFSLNEVKACSAEDCPLFKYRVKGKITETV